jgi:hypothetical protein
MFILEYAFYWILSTVVTVFINRTFPQKYALSWLRLLLKYNVKAKTYDKLFKVKKWKHKLPQLSAVDKNVHDKSKISYDYENLLEYRDALEKGVFAHTFPVVALVVILMSLSKSTEVILLNSLLMTLFHLPFALSQLYNHVRISKLIKSKERNYDRLKIQIQAD